jgi:hypothetical protein
MAGNPVTFYVFALKKIKAKTHIVRMYCDVTCVSDVE